MNVLEGNSRRQKHLNLLVPLFFPGPFGIDSVVGNPDEIIWVTGVNTRLAFFLAKCMSAFVITFCHAVMMSNQKILSATLMQTRYWIYSSERRKFLRRGLGLTFAGIARIFHCNKARRLIYPDKMILSIVRAVLTK